MYQCSGAPPGPSPVSMRPKKSPAPGEREVLQRLLDGDLDVLGRELVGRALRIDPLEAVDHPVPGRARERQPLALDRQLGEGIHT